MATMWITRGVSAKVAGYHLSLVVPLLPVLAVGVGFYWLAPAVVFFVMPALGLIIGTDRSEPLRPDLHRIVAAWLRVIPRVWVVLWLATLVWCASFAAQFEGSALQLAGVVFGAAITSAFATPISHELFHNKNAFDYRLGRFAIAVCGFGQLLHEHIEHHRCAVTAGDQSVAAEGENVYRFAVRATAAGVRSAWRAGRRSGRPNAMLIDLSVIAAAYAIFAIAWGAGVVVLVGQSVFAVFCFEAINFIQHYGLRRSDAESFAPSHAWEHYCWLANCITLNNPLHADHHMHAERRYYELVRNEHGAPLLPVCYVVLFLVSLVPPVFRMLMRRAVRRNRLRPALRGA